VSGAPVIAIDGPSGSGKGTVSRLVARELHWRLLDSGALYRIVALASRRGGLDPQDGAALARLTQAMEIRFASAADGREQVFMDGDEVTQDIRTEEMGGLASVVAAHPGVRSALLERQRAFAQPPGLVADGRDMGSVVFPAARLKIFLTASVAERAERRYKQLKDKGVTANLAALSLEIAERDRRDSTRAVAPLVASADAVIIDSTHISAAEVAQKVVELARTRQLTR
jgi:CMP/dCMP kinase